MNRTIKYRVWDHILSEWIKSDQLVLRPNGSITDGSILIDSKYIQFNTSLNDKNGKEIYEGDIVKFSRLFEKERKIKELKSFVRFDEGKFGFDLIGFNGMFYDLSDEFSIEVIGNIFEHSELLK